MAVDEYNKLFKSNQLSFGLLNLCDLPDSTREYVTLWVVSFCHPILVHKEPIDGVYLFKIGHPIVQYLIHNSIDQSHMWGDKRFENINNNLALAMLSEKTTGIGIERAQDILDHIDAAVEDEK